MDFDELLNLEEDFYREGYEEGRKENSSRNFLEGKQYGLQIGYQRFHLLGIIYGICQTLSRKCNDPPLEKTIGIVNQMIQDLNMDNKEETVQIYENRMFKIRNKFRLISMNLQKQKNIASYDDDYKITLQTVESLAKELAGEVQGYLEENDNTAVNVRDQSNDW